MEVLETLFQEHWLKVRGRQIPSSFLRIESKNPPPTMKTFWQVACFYFFKALEGMSAILSPTSCMLKIGLFVNNIQKIHILLPVNFTVRIAGSHSQFLLLYSLNKLTFKFLFKVHPSKVIRGIS